MVWGITKIDYNVIRGLATTPASYEALIGMGNSGDCRRRALRSAGQFGSDGKNDLPAAGFAGGRVVLAELLKDRKLLPEFNQSIDAFVLIEDEPYAASRLCSRFAISAECGIFQCAPETRQTIQGLRNGALYSARLTAARSCDQEFEHREELPLAKVAEQLV